MPDASARPASPLRSRAWPALLANMAITAAAVIPLVLVDRVPWLPCRQPAPGQWFLWLTLSDSIYETAFLRAAVALAAQVVAAALLRFVARADASLAEYLARPLRWVGLAALLCLFPLAPASAALAPFLRFAAIAAVSWRGIELLRRLWRRPAPAGLTANAAGLLALAVALTIHLPLWFRVACTPTRGGSCNYLLTGDQPIYLSLTESLVRDGDVDLSNTELPASIGAGLSDKGNGVSHLNPGLPKDSPLRRRLEAAWDGAKYSNHRHGLAILLAPFYFAGRLAGGLERQASTLLILLFVAAGIREIVLAGCRLGLPPWAALAAGSATALSVPVVCLSTAIYAELAVFYVMARMIRIAVERDTSRLRDAEVAAWLAFAPWLQDKYLVWLLPFYILRLARARTRPLSLPTMLALPAVSAALMIRRNLYLYGTATPPTAPLGRFLSVTEALTGGMPGTWFDWGYGLAVLAPFVLLLFAGLMAWGRRQTDAGDRSAFWTCLAASFGGWLVASTWISWHGGFAPPNRFMLTLVPFCALAAALATRHLPRPTQNTAVLLWLLTVALGRSAAEIPGLWYSRSHPARSAVRLLRLDGFAARYHRFSDGFAASDLLAVAVALAGLALAAYFAFAMWMAARPSPPKTRNGLLPARIVLALLLAAAALMTAVRRDSIHIGASDVPIAIGFLREPAVEEEASGSVALRCTVDFFRNSMPDSCAMSVHYIDAHGNKIGQDDFDLRAARDAWLAASADNRATYRISGRFEVRHTCRPPAAATHARIGVYSPQRNRPYPSLLRTPRHVLALPG